ncbi:meiosis regulator and mRNA stability factor 1-like [Anopheles albimanus]|uniref:HTH OST-type domain-containing protein n=1 Tax=Anopheles albimanus TaxID=7167 RepID=A0A182F3W9_ANOAL|nr:meiosis regulator and mRNA stability factor 1-like [Anopheles albimanus]XP_035774819.1 meiosis regulator and mRNA stability factor 1-like [Anopheles albimanus]
MSNNSMTNSIYDSRSFPDLVANLTAESAKMYNGRLPYPGQGGFNMKGYSQQGEPHVSQMYGHCNQKQRYTPYPSPNYGGIAGAPGNCGAPSSNQSNLCPSNANQLQPPFQPGNSYGQQPVSNKSLNSSLNSSGSDSGKNSTFYSNNTSDCSSPHQSNYSTDSLSTGTSISNLSASMNTSGTGTGTGVLVPIPPSEQPSNGTAPDPEKESVVLQISNLDASIEEHKMRQYLLCQLKPITPVLSLSIESPSLAKVKVPSAQCAKQVVANLHRKKIGHKRMVVSYIKDPSSAESSALRCQVAGLLNDVPCYSLPVNRFRELFQSRFKSSICVLDLYRMQDVCTVSIDKNDEKYITLHPNLVDTLRNNPLVESSQHSVPYCMYHFKQQKEKGWAEQEIEPLPNIMMSINQLQSLIYSLLKTHKSDIPVASILYCIEHELQVNIIPNENGVPLEHLLCCIRGVQITNNSFGIKVLSWLDHELNSSKDNDDGWSANLRYMPISPSNEFLQQISREVVELIKMSPKSTMRFTRFIPAYHNHFGKQCRVADYGYTRLIELFEALAPVVQVMGDGENRHITLTHRTQIRRFTNDLLKILRNRPSKSILLSQLPVVFSQAQNRLFDVTDYGVCDIYDIVDGLVYSNSIVTKVCNEVDMLISIVKRKQTPAELEKTAVFAAEVLELFRKAPQFSIPFKKLVRSYHYHFGYQCRLSDYGLLKLSDLLETLGGLVEMEQSNDEDRKTYLNYRAACRIFAEQVQEIIKHCTGNPCSTVRLNGILNVHKNKYGYQLQAGSLGFCNMFDAIKALPYTEVYESGGEYMVISHMEDPTFRMRTYAVCIVLIESQKDRLPIFQLARVYQQRFRDCLNEKQIASMKHAVTIEVDKGLQTVTMTPLMKFVVRMVQVLKQQAPITMYDLKQTLNVSLGTCFEFGYPNLSSVINAFADVFNAANLPYLNERSEIDLNRECILSKVSFDDRSGAMGNGKLPTVDGPFPPSGISSANMPYGGDPSWRNGSNLQNIPPMPLLNDPFGMKALQQQAAASQQYRQGAQQQMLPLQALQSSQQLTQQRPPLNPIFANNNNPNVDLPNPWYNGNNGNPMMPFRGDSVDSFYKEANYQNALLAMQNGQIENSLNKFRSSDYALDLLPAAFQAGCSMQQTAANSNLAAVHTQPRIMEQPPIAKPRLAVDHFDNEKRNLTELYSSRKSLLELVSNNFAPPKPDTPPATNLPFWLDPIWNDTLSSLECCSIGKDPNILLNIPIPELKICDNLPPLDTPSILMPKKEQIFTFDQDE